MQSRTFFIGETNPPSVLLIAAAVRAGADRDFGVTDMRAIMVFVCVALGSLSSFASGLPGLPGVSVENADGGIVCRGIFDSWLLVRARKNSGEDFLQLYEKLREENRCMSAIRLGKGRMRLVSSYTWLEDARTFTGAWVYELRPAGASRSLYVITGFPRDDAAALP